MTKLETLKRRIEECRKRQAVRKFWGEEFQRQLEDGRRHNHQLNQMHQESGALRMIEEGNQAAMDYLAGAIKARSLLY